MSERALVVVSGWRGRTRCLRVDEADPPVVVLAQWADLLGAQSRQPVGFGRNVGGPQVKVHAVLDGFALGTLWNIRKGPSWLLVSAAMAAKSSVAPSSTVQGLGPGGATGDYTDGPTAWDGYAAAAVCAAGVRSLQTGETVAVDMVSRGLVKGA